MTQIEESKLSRWCDGAILHGLGALGLLIALSHSVRGHNPLLIKTALLDAGAALLGAAWVIKTLQQGWPGISKTTTLILLPAFAFLLSALASYFFVTTSRDTSFDELAVRIPYFVVMAIAALEFRDMRRTRILCLWLLAAAPLFCLIGLGQHFGFLLHLSPVEGRIASTFGNPNFYVGFLIPIIGLSISFFDYGCKYERGRLLPCVVAAMAAPILYFACTFFLPKTMVRAGIFLALAAAVAAICLVRRAAAATAAVMLIFLLFCNLLLTYSRSGQIGGAVLLVAFAVLCALFVMQTSAIKKILFAGGLAAALVSLMLTSVLLITKSRSEATIERKYFALGATDLIKQKPFFGHGIGTYKNNYPLVKRLESWQYNLVCFEFTSNVYNEFLEIWQDEGIVGLAIFLWLLAMVFGLGIAALHRERAQSPPAPDQDFSARAWHSRIFSPSPAVLLIGLMSGAGALLFSNIFSLSMRYSATGFIFWMVLGLITARIAATAPAEGRDANLVVQKRPGIWRATAVIRLAQATAIAIALVFVHAAWRYYRAEIAMASAIERSRNAYRPVGESGEVFHDIYIEGTTYYSDPAEWELAIGAYLRAIRDNPHYLRAKYFLANAFNRRWNQQPVCNPHWGDPPGVARTDAQRALELYSAVSAQAPNYIEIEYEKGNLYLKLGEIDKAVACYNEYKRIRPFFTKIHAALAEAYLAKRDWPNAVEAFKDALDLNKRFVVAYCQLSFAYDQMGDTALARDACDRALEIAPLTAYRHIAGVYAQHRQWEKAADYALKQTRADSLDATGFRDLGWYRLQAAQWQAAIEAYERAVRLDSANVSSLITLSNLYYQEKRLDESAAAYRKAMAMDPVAVQKILAEMGQN